MEKLYTLTGVNFDGIKFLSENSHLISSIIVVVISIILSKVLKRVIYDSVIFFSSEKDKTKQNILLKSYCNIIANVVKYFIYGIAIIIILIIYEVQITVMIASAGFIGVMVTYFFQDLIKDITNGFFIVFSSPFQIGDHVKINSFVGVVKEIQSRYVVIIDVSGNKAVINNRAIDQVVVLQTKINFRKKVK